MDNSKTQKQAVLGTLVNEDASGVIAYSDQIYDKKEAKSVEDIGADHEERVKQLEAWDGQLQDTIEGITKTGEASAASNVTYNHNDSQLDASNVQQAIDEVYSKGNSNVETTKEELNESLQDVYKKSNYNDGDEVIDFNSIHLVEDNPEYFCALCDAEDKLVVGIQKNGNPIYGVGVPSQVKDYVDTQINKILGTNDITDTIDSLKEIEAFLKDFKNNDTLKALLDDNYKKSNPNDEDGNPIATNSIVSVKENPEFVDAKTDVDDKLLESTDIEGKKTFYGDAEIKGKFTQDGVLHYSEENPEFLCVLTDNEDKLIVGIDRETGSPKYGVGVPTEIKKYIDKQINNIFGNDDTTDAIDSLNEVKNFLAGFTNKDTLYDLYKRSNPNDSEGNVIDTNSIVSVGDNPEYIKALVDSTNKLIEAIGLDGVRKFFAGINIQGVSQCVTDNPEYIAAWLDSEDKIILAIELDGNPYFGYGVPKQIQEVLDTINNALTVALEDIDKKINLGNDTYPSNVHEVSDNPEYISAIVDAAEKLLEAYGVDGVKRLFTAIELMGTRMSVEDNPEFIKVLADAGKRLIESIGIDGVKTLYNDVKVLGEVTVDGDFSNHGIVHSVQATDEYQYLLLDAANRIIEILHTNGIREFLAGIIIQGALIGFAKNNEYISVELDNDKRILRAITADGVNYLPKAKVDELTLNDDKFITNIKELVKSTSVATLNQYEYLTKDYFDIEVFNPDDIYVLEGTTLQIFKNSLANVVNQDDYELRLLNLVNVENNAKYGANYNYCYEYTATNELLTFGFTPALYCGITKTVYNGTPCTIHTIEKATSPSSVKNVLCIGDSFTDGEVWVAELRRLLTGETSSGSASADSTITADSLTNINFIGTRHTATGHTPNEGWSGQHYRFFAGGGSDTLPDTTSPFINPNTNEVDFDYYMGTGNVKGSLQDVSDGDKIDYAIIVLGTNANYNEQYVTAIWDALLVHNADIKVIISGRCNACTHGMPVAIYHKQTYTSLSNNTIPCNSFLKEMTQRDAYKNNFLYVDYGISLDVIYNMPHTIVSANIRNDSDEAKILRGTNNVHPATKGYYQMADAFRGPFHYWFLGNN